MGSAGRFLANVAWSWLGVVIGLISGLIVSPYIIFKVGHEGYGVWALVFSLIEYYWFLDLGFRSATVKYSAHYRATGELERINEIVNTGLIYYSGIAAVLLLATALLSKHAPRFFHLSPESERIFPALVFIVGVSWSLGSVFNVFNACIEGFQRFDLVSRIWITSMGIRSAGMLVLLSLGYGLIALALMVVASQVMGYILSFLAFRKIFPAHRFSFSFVRFSALRQLAGYGVHTFVATAGGRFVHESVPVLIGYFKPAAFVGYYALPVRLLQYSVDAISKVGAVTGPSTAELAARGDFNSISRLGMYVNRYCLALFMPLGIFLAVFGRETISIWIGADFASYSAPLLPPLVLAAAIAMAGQFNSSSILYGLGKHGGYARALLVEGFISFATLLIVIPRFGILGAAWSASILAILNRGIFTGWLVSRNLNFSFKIYMRSIYTRPMVLSAPVFVLMTMAKRHLLTGGGWSGLVLAGMLSAALYFPAAYFACVPKPQRKAITEWVSTRLAAHRQLYKW